MKDQFAGSEWKTWCCEGRVRVWIVRRVGDGGWDQPRTNLDQPPHNRRLRWEPGG